MRILPLVLLLAAIVAASLLSDLLFPGDKILIVSSNPRLAKRFALATAQKSNAQVDILCVNECTMFNSVSFNCAADRRADDMLPCVLNWYLNWYRLLQLRTYKDVYLVESGSPLNLARTPFDDDAYTHVNREFRRNHTAKVSVVFTDVTCEGMREHMRSSRTVEEKCKQSAAGRNEMFYQFFIHVAIRQGDLYHDFRNGALYHDYQYIDYDA